MAKPLATVEVNPRPAEPTRTSYCVVREGEDWVLVELKTRGKSVLSESVLVKDRFRRVCLVKAERLMGVEG